MEIISKTGRIPTKRVVIHFVKNETDEAVLDLALSVTGEDRSSIFGWAISRGDGDTAMVTLHTD